LREHRRVQHDHQRDHPDPIVWLSTVASGATILGVTQWATGGVGRAAIQALPRFRAQRTPGLGPRVLLGGVPRPCSADPPATDRSAEELSLIRHDRACEHW
jgi:hypothetical protein